MKPLVSSCIGMSRATLTRTASLARDAALLGLGALLVIDEHVHPTQASTRRRAQCSITYYEDCYGGRRKRRTQVAG